MPLGYLTHVADHRDAHHRRAASPATVYRDTIRLAVEAEQFGFDSFWVAQHHGGHQGGYLPSPLVLLAALAEHTSTIRLGTAVVVAPLEHPVRLAEDAAVLDELTGGRLELGLGAGAAPEASARFGVPHEERHQRCFDVFDELLSLVDSDDLVPSAGALRNRLWLASGTRSGADFAAQRGVGLLSGRKSSGPNGPHSGDREAAAHIQSYLTSAETAPRVAVSRPVLPDMDQVDLHSRLSPWIWRGIDSGRFPHGFSASAYLNAGNLYHGDAGAIADQLRTDPAYVLADELLCHSQPITLGFDEQLRLLETLGTKVAPHLDFGRSAS